MPCSSTNIIVVIIKDCWLFDGSTFSSSIAHHGLPVGVCAIEKEDPATNVFIAATPAPQSISRYLNIKDILHNMCYWWVPTSFFYLFWYSPSFQSMWRSIRTMIISTSHLRVNKHKPCHPSVESNYKQIRGYSSLNRSSASTHYASHNPSIHYTKQWIAIQPLRS